MRYQALSEDLDYQLATLKERHRFVDKILDIVLRLNDYSSVAGMSVSPKDVLAETLKRLKVILDCTASGFFLINDDATFSLSGWEGDPDILEAEKRILVMDGSFAWALYRNRPTIIRSSDGHSSIILHSVSTSNRTMGVFMGIIPLNKGDLLDFHLYFMTVVLNSAARVLQCIELFSMIRGLNTALEDKIAELTVSERELAYSKEKLEKQVHLRTSELNTVNFRLSRTLMGVVDAMSKVVETRDPYTAGHQRRVAHIAVSIAKALKLPDSEVEGIRVAGLLHDVGQVAIPAEILSKPGRLSPLEFRIVQSHPEVGYDILKSIDFPWPVADMVRQHHERLDGSGYPLGIKGDKMLIGSKCLAVADVVEAMPSHRPYRPGLTSREVKEELLKNRGTAYDPQVVDIALSLMDEPDFAKNYLQ